MTDQPSPSPKAKQCKDIPDHPILELLAESPNEWHNWFDENQWDGNIYTVRRAIPQDIPDKLLLAKMSTLIRRGLVDGCPCGCRGDFVITSKGQQFLSENSHE
jgi:hypothetical protein